MSDQQIDDILEHFGIKGMRWGVRNQRKLDRVNRVARGTKIRNDRRNKIIRRASAVGIIGGTAFVSAIIARQGMVSIKEADRMSNIRAAKHLMAVHRHVKMSSIHNAELAREIKTFASKF